MIWDYKNHLYLGNCNYNLHLWIVLTFSLRRPHAAYIHILAHSWPNCISFLIENFLNANNIRSSSSASKPKRSMELASCDYTDIPSFWRKSQIYTQLRWHDFETCDEQEHPLVKICDTYILIFEHMTWRYRLNMYKSEKKSCLITTVAVACYLA